MAVRLAEEDRGSESSSFDFYLPIRRVPHSWMAIVSNLCTNVGGLRLTEDVYKKIGSDSKAWLLSD